MTSAPFVGPRSSAPERRASSMRPARGRILVVDDDPSALGALARLLTSDGFAVTVASSGSEAMSALERETPDAVVSDVHMPRMTGLTLLGLARSRFPGLIVVLVSAENSRPLAAIEGGANGYLTKPIDVDELVGLLDFEIQVAREREDDEPSTPIDERL